jgi:hypothetical protein
MRTFIYLLLSVFSLGSLQAQDQFENRVKEIKIQITNISTEEKAKLQKEVEDINKKLERKEITSSEAEKQKNERAQSCADRIEKRVRPLEEELQRIVKGEVENAEVKSNDNPIDDIKSEIDESMSDIKTTIKEKKNRKKSKSENLTTSQFVFAFGLNNILTDGKLNSISNNGIKAGTSRFYEWGVTWKSRLSQNSPLLNIKYGLSLTYNNLRPENNTYFVKSVNQTVIQPFGKDLYTEPYFRTTNLVIPVHLEFDFSKKMIKDDQPIIKTQRSLRIGLGGYAGINTRTKQIYEYKEDGLRNTITSKGDWNTNTFVYGLSGYIGYKNMSLYTKYDLNPFFANNNIKQNNVSLGLRFDFH